MRYRYLGRRRYGQDHRQLLHLTGEVSGRKVVTKSARRGVKYFTEASNNSRKGINNSRRHQIIHGGAYIIHGGVKKFTEEGK